MSKKVEKEILHIYTRVSSKVQEEEGVSLQNQRQKGIEVSKRLGMDYVLHNEGSKSSYTEDLMSRPVIMDMMDGIRDGEIKHLYVTDFDRLSRNRGSWFIILRDLEKYGVTCYVGDGLKFELDDPYGRMFLSFSSTISQFDQEQRTRRFQQNKIRKFVDGYYVHGTTPFGFEKRKPDKKGKKLFVHPVNGKIVRYMYTMFSKGKSIKQIQDWLVSEKIRSPRNNILWGHQQIINILRNEHYIGKTIFHENKTDSTYHGKCPRIVNDRLWYSVKQIWIDYDDRQQQKKKQKHEYLLTGMLYCGVCGYLCRGKRNPKVYKNIYFCGSKEERWRTPKYDKCDRVKSKSVNIDRLDDLVWKTYLDTLKNSHIIRKQQKSLLLTEGKSTKIGIQKQIKDKEIERKEQELKLKNHEKKRLHLYELWINDKIEEPDRVKLDEQIEKNIFETKSRIEGIEQHMSRLHESTRWIDWLKIYSDDVKRMERVTDVQKKKDILKQKLQRVEVQYDPDQKVHLIEMYLRLPLFNDKFVVVGTEGKKSLYEVQNGKRNKVLMLDKTKVGRKKNPVQS